MDKLIEKVAKLAYQFAELIDDKEIDGRWYNLDNREQWFDFAEVAIPIIQKAERERIGRLLFNKGVPDMLDIIGHLLRGKIEGEINDKPTD